MKNTELNNVKELIAYSVKNFPNDTAFTVKIKANDEVDYRKISYKEFGEEINAFGTELLSLGLKDKRVAIIGKNSYEWMLSYCTILNGVGIAVPLDKGLPEEEIIYSLQKSKADAIIYEKEYSSIMEKIKNEKLCNVEKYIQTSDIPNLIKNGKEKIENGDTSYIDREIDNEKMSIILFTSGTTSLAKAVMLSHKNIVSNVSAMNKTYKFFSSDVNIAFLPFHHTFGSTAILLMLSNGVNNVFCDGLRHVQENLKEYKVSVFVSVPLILESMHKKIMQTIEKTGKTKMVKTAKKVSGCLLNIGIDVRRKLFKEIIDNLGGSLRFVFTGAAALNKQVSKDFNAFGINTIQGYGLTETSPVVSGELPTKIRYGSVGTPLDNVQMRIVEPDANGVGEIAVKGPNVMLGYYEDEEATNKVLKDGWFYTGDLGYKGKDNYFYISGRKKSVIVLKNGKNVYPEELETLVNELPYVSESMVFGFPKGDDSIISAKIVYNKEYINNNYPNVSKEELEELIWNDIKDKVNSRLINFKHIKKLIVTDEPMIKTTTAKIKRYKEFQKILDEEAKK